MLLPASRWVNLGDHRPPMQGGRQYGAMVQDPWEKLKRPRPAQDLVTRLRRWELSPTQVARFHERQKGCSQS